MDHPGAIVLIVNNEVLGGCSTHGRMKGENGVNCLLKALGIPYEKRGKRTIDDLGSFFLGFSQPNLHTYVTRLIPQ
jgi:hypothetical protein